MGEKTVSVAEFARRLKEKYPKYATAADDKLVVAFCQKFAQYKVNYEAGTPVSVTVISNAAAPAAPSAADSSKTAHVGDESPSEAVNEVARPSPAPSAPSDLPSETAEKVSPQESVPASASAPVTPARVESEIGASHTAPVVSAPTITNAESTAKADVPDVVAHTTSRVSSVQLKPHDASTDEPSGDAGSRIGAILVGILIIVALGGFGAYRLGLIPWKSLPSSNEEQVTRPAVDDSGSGGDIGEYISGRTTYSDQFVNVESIRIRRSGEGSVLTATVYNKGETRLKSISIRVNCYSPNGKQVVTASFNIQNLGPGERSSQDMTGVLGAVPSRVDIVSVDRY